jgi:hypothetical protein
LHFAAAAAVPWRATAGYLAHRHLFHWEISFEIGSTLELPFCLPAEKERNSCVLARATVKTIRAWELPGEPTPLFGIAVTIERIDFAHLLLPPPHEPEVIYSYALPLRRVIVI